MAAWSAPPTSDAKGFQAARAASNELPKVIATVGRSAVLFAAVGVAFAIGDNLSEQVMDKKSPVNGFFGGVCGGALIGLQTRRLDVAAGAALGCGLLSMGLEMNGPKIITNPQMWERRFGLRKAEEKAA